ncbi:sperm-associated antigen 8 [Scleropages formosus]|uniref:Sperm associated antigen 8 n=1 Tax=Scleropages formosus TaxID=113540 RepID=A0A8C9R8H4_SCLFO|nr:sperm-associated antigen 8 [Scleropages formosus]
MNVRERGTFAEKTSQGRMMKSSEDVVVGKKSRAKCLLHNWVEERATASLDKEENIHKRGHKGILTLDFLSKFQGVSAVKAAFTPPRGPGVREKGIREELLKKQLYETIGEKVLEEFNFIPSSTEYVSSAKRDYDVEGFESTIPPPSQEHDYRNEEAITFWSDNHDKITGVSAVRTRDTPFKKNCTFSTPISEQLFEDMPRTLEPDPRTCTRYS